MRNFVRSMTVITLVLSFGLMMTNTAGAERERGTTCSTMSGTAILDPPLPKLGNPTMVRTTVHARGTVGGCIGGDVRGATFTSTLHRNDPQNCASVAAGTLPPHLPAGTIVLRWNTGKTSTWRFTFQPVPGHPEQQIFGGRVIKGVFKSFKVHETVSFLSTPGECITTDLSTLSITLITRLDIRPQAHHDD